MNHATSFQKAEPKDVDFIFQSLKNSVAEQFVLREAASVLAPYLYGSIRLFKIIFDHLELYDQ